MVVVIRDYEIWSPVEVTFSSHLLRGDWLAPSEQATKFHDTGRMTGSHYQFDK